MKYLIRTAEVQRFSNEINVNKGNSVSIWKAVRKTLSEKPNQQLQYTKDTKFLAAFWLVSSISAGECVGNWDSL